MKSCTKNSYKKLLALSLITLLPCQIKTDDQKTTKSVASLHNDIASLGTGSDVSGVNGALVNLGANGYDISSIYSDFASLGTDSDVSNLHTLISAIPTFDTSTLATGVNLAKLGTDSDTSGLYTLIGDATSGGDSTPSGIYAAIADLASTVSGYSTDLFVSVDTTGLATTGDVSDIEGGGSGDGQTPFVAYSNDTTAGDSLHNISTNNISVPFATHTDITNLGSSSSDPSHLYTLIHAIPTFDTSTLATHTDATDIQGSGFVKADNSLVALTSLLTTIITQQTTDPVLQVTFAAANGALTTTVTCSTGDPSTYNTDIATALGAITTATTNATQSTTNTTAAQSALSAAIGDFNTLITTWGSTDGPVTSTYTEAQIRSALAQLQTALTNLATAQTTI